MSAIQTFNSKTVVEDLSVVVSKLQVIDKNYSFAAGQYYNVKIQYNDISHIDFIKKIEDSKRELIESFNKSKDLEKLIIKDLNSLLYEPE